MELVWRYLFWLLLIVVLGAACAWYFTTVPAMADSIKAKIGTEGEPGSLRGLEKQVNDLCAHTKDIRTADHVRKMKEHREDLKAQSKKAQTVLQGRRTTLGERFEAAPQDMLQFDRWLVDVRKEILEMAAKAGLALPANFRERWLDEGRTTPDKAVRQDRLERVALAAEVVRLFAEIKAAVPVYRFTPKADEAEPQEFVQKGAISLDDLERLPNDKRLERDRKWVSQAYGMAATGPVDIRNVDIGNSPAASLHIRFTAPPQAVAPLMQALESSERWFGIVRRFDMQRAAECYPRASDGSAPDAKDGRAAPANSRYAEGPVQVMLWVDLLDLSKWGS